MKKQNRVSDDKFVQSFNREKENEQLKQIIDSQKEEVQSLKRMVELASKHEEIKEQLDQIGTVDPQEKENIVPPKLVEFFDNGNRLQTLTTSAV